MAKMKALSRLLLVCVASCGPLWARAGSLTVPDPVQAPVENAALKSREAVESGNKLRGERKFEEALTAYQGALRLQPQNSNAWFFLGVTYVNLERFEDARASFRRSVLSAPDDPAKWTGLCLSHYVLGDFSNAIHTCQEALRLDPNQAEGWAWLGLGYARQQEWDKAIRSLELATALGTRSGEAWYTLGVRYARQGQRGKVLQVYRRLQEIDPDQARRLYLAALARQTRG